ncbi:mechanosensitive ion channel [bacterium]|nr:mechanosensitive ion channel [bacterium]
MRSTTIRTNTNIDIVVPNQSFIQNNIINWTHHDSVVMLKIPF